MKLLLILLLTIFLFSCKKDKLEGEHEILIGNWEWSQTIHYTSDCKYGTIWRVDSLTPTNTGSTSSIELLKKGRINIFSNNDKIESGRVVFDGWVFHDNKYHFQIEINNNEDKFLAGFIYNDTILLREYFLSDLSDYCKEGGANCCRSEFYFIKKK